MSWKRNGRDVRELASISAFLLLSAASLSAQEMRIITSPPIGQESTVPAGAEIYSFIRRYTIDGYQLDSDTKAGHWLLTAPVKAGTRLVPVDTSKAAKACVPIEGSFEPNGPCFIDDDGDGKFDRQSANQVTMFRKVKPPVCQRRYKMGPTTGLKTGQSV